MGRVEQSTTVNASPEKAFSYLADISKHTEWAAPAHKLQIEKTSEGPVAQGSTFKSAGHQFGENNDAITITELVDNQRVVYEADGNAGLMRHSFELAPADGGVQVTKTFEPVKAKFPFSLFAPLAQMFVVPAGLRGDLARIKAKLEG